MTARDSLAEPRHNNPTSPEQTAQRLITQPEEAATAIGIKRSGSTQADEGALKHPDEAIRTETMKRLVQTGVLPGVLIDFASDHNHRLAQTPQPDDHRTRQPINDTEARFVADQIRALGQRRSSVDHTTGEVYEEMAAPHRVRELAKSLSVLSQSDLGRVSAAYGGAGITEAIKSNPYLKDSDKERLSIYAEGVEKRQSDPGKTLRLAELALSERSLSDFSEAFAQATPAARNAFFENKSHNPLLGQQAIDKSFSAEDRVTASEFARAGKISSLTEIKRETGSFYSFTNYEGVERTIKHLSPQESAALNRGAALAEMQKAGKLPDDLSPALKEDLARHNQFDAALQSAAGNNATRLEYWRALSQQSGQSSSVLDAIAAEGGRLYNGNLTDRVFGSAPLERLTGKWDRHSYDFYNDKVNGESRQEMTRKVLSTFSNGQQLIEQFDKQAHAPTFEQSLKAAGRTDATGSSGSDLIQELKTSVLVSPDGPVSIKPSSQILRTIDRAMAEDPQLRAQLSDPQTPANHALRDEIRKTMKTLVGDNSETYRNYLTLERGNGLPPEAWSQLDRQEKNSNHTAFFEDLGRQPKDVREQLALDPQRQERLLGHLDLANQQIAQQILKHGLRPIDQLQAAHLNNDARGVEDAVRKGIKGDLAQFKRDYESTYGESVDSIVREQIGGQKGIQLERALSGDKSAIGQFQTDLKIQSELRAPVLDTIASVFGSNAPRRERESFDEYAASVGRTANVPDGPTRAKAEVMRAQEKYRDERDALNATEKDVVTTTTSVALTAVGGITTGGAGWPALAALRQGGAAALREFGTLTAASVANPVIRSEALGRLHDGSPDTYLKDSLQGGLATYFGGGNLGSLKLATPGFIQRAAERSALESAIAAGKELTKEQLASAAKRHDYVTAFGHTVYPFTSNLALTTGVELADGKSPGDAIWSGLTNGTLAASGVGTGWTLSRGARTFAPSVISDGAQWYISKPELNIPVHRAGFGGSAKLEGKEARGKSPDAHKAQTAGYPLPGIILDF